MWMVCALLMPVPTPAVAANMVSVGEPLRAALLRGLNGPSKQLADVLGRPLIINVWASWCGPCRDEMSSLERLAWGDMGRRLTIIGISTDDYPAQAKDWLKSSNATISQYIDTDLQMEQMLGASHLPLTVLIDAKGRVLARVYGARQWDAPESLTLISRTFRLSQHQ